MKSAYEEMEEIEAAYEEICSMESISPLTRGEFPSFAEYLKAAREGRLVQRPGLAKIISMSPYEEYEFVS